jgi:dCTP deaminase
VSGGILSGPEIARAVSLGRIRIEPFSSEQLNPASYDVTLGDEVLTYCLWRDTGLQTLDARREPWTKRRFMGSDEGLLLEPSVGYLMHTRERIWTDSFIPILDGKSSIGRLFVQIHQTAGFGDPGFDGQYTMEVTCTHPVRLYAGMRIAQMRFHTICGEVKLYAGNYQGEASTGPVASRAWKQLEGKVK